MMNKKQITNEAFDAILQSTHGMQRAEMPPFFFTRLENKLLPKPSINRWQMAFTIMLKPAFAIATLILFIILNIGAIFEVRQSKKTSSVRSETVTLQGFAKEYDISISSNSNY